MITINVTNTSLSLSLLPSMFDVGQEVTLQTPGRSDTTVEIVSLVSTEVSWQHWGGHLTVQTGQGVTEIISLSQDCSIVIIYSYESRFSKGYNIIN